MATETSVAALNRILVYSHHVRDGEIDLPRFLGVDQANRTAEDGRDPDRHFVTLVGDLEFIENPFPLTLLSFVATSMDVLAMFRMAQRQRVAQMVIVGGDGGNPLIDLLVDQAAVLPDGELSIPNDPQIGDLDGVDLDALHPLDRIHPQFIDHHCFHTSTIRSLHPHVSGYPDN